MLSLEILILLPHNRWEFRVHIIHLPRFYLWKCCWLGYVGVHRLLYDEVLKHIVMLLVRSSAVIQRRQQPLERIFAAQLAIWEATVASLVDSQACTSMRALVIRVSHSLMMPSPMPELGMNAYRVKHDPRQSTNPFRPFFLFWTSHHVEQTGAECTRMNANLMISFLISKSWMIDQSWLHWNSKSLCRIILEVTDSIMGLPISLYQVTSQRRWEGHRKKLMLAFETVLNFDMSIDLVTTKRPLHDKTNQGQWKMSSLLLLRLAALESGVEMKNAIHQFQKSEEKLNLETRSRCTQRPLSSTGHDGSSEYSYRKIRLN